VASPGPSERSGSGRLEKKGADARDASPKWGRRTTQTLTAYRGAAGLTTVDQKAFSPLATSQHVKKLRIGPQHADHGQVALLRASGGERPSGCGAAKRGYKFSPSHMDLPFYEPDRQISRIRLSDKTSRLHPRHVVPKPAQAYEPEVPVKVREWISTALASPG
jgi:hypothetical protein